MLVYRVSHVYSSQAGTQIQNTSVQYKTNKQQKTVIP